MSAADIVTDPTLKAVLESIALVRDHSMAMADKIDKIGASGQQPSKEETDELLQAEMHLHSLMAQLRGRNKQAIMHTRATKQETADRRQEVDTLRLQLQNLNYEQNHLRGEIVACEEYNHSYQSLPMIPVEEFLEQRPEHTNSSPHDLTIARIEHERKSRQLLEELRALTVTEKEALMKETTAKKEELGKLDADIEKWVNGKEPVLKQLEAHEKKVAEAKKLAEEEAKDDSDRDGEET